ncbi:MAG: glycoside hydrolase family 3 protein [Deltaproteobacteria bacterium]|nr:glycoside hydrolase family 3 protein [Deltaproteobacteria bacterium]
MTPHASEARLAGCRLMVGFNGTHLDADLKYLIRDLGVSGIILFKRNICDPEQVRRLVRSAQDFALACGRDPLFVAVDQEGGEVARLKGPFFTEFPGNPHIQNTAGARRFAETTSLELKSVGINMNMAPVLDVVPAGIDGVMTKRSFGSDPVHVSALGRVVISRFQEKGVLSVAKHFPGMGRAVKDPHVDPIHLPVLLSKMETSDLVPFKDAVETGVSGIMLSHLVYTQIDPDWPASLSGVIARDLLRKRMGFDGLVITDDLNMGAVDDRYSIETLAGRILEAQIDVALICHRTEKMEDLFDAIRKSLEGSSAVRASAAVCHQRITRIKDAFFRPA